MTGYWTTVMTMVWKDVLTELRSKDVITAILSFAILSLVILNFALSTTPQLTRVIAPGILWVSFTFAGVLGLTRAFALEKDRGSLEGLMLAPAGRDALYVGKMLGSLAFMLAAEAILLPVFAVLFNVSPFQPMLLLVILLATLGFVAVGSLFSAIAVNTRSREIMLPVLFLPIVTPIVIGAVVASGYALDGRPWGDIAKWVQLIAIFDVLALVFCSFAFEHVIEE